MASILSSLRSDRRSTPRDEVFVRTSLWLKRGPALSCELVNLSTGGFMARLDAIVSPGDAITVRLPGLGEREAKAAWALGGRLGAEFAQPIDQGSYDALIARLPRER